MADGEEPKRQQRGEESRTALLDAGIELLTEQDLDTILSARAVARRADRSTGSFFHYWESTDEYISDLLDYVLRPGSVPQVEEMGAMLDHFLRDQSKPVALLRTVLEQDFRNTVNDPLLPVEMLLWSRNADPRVRAALRRFYSWTDEVAIGRCKLIAEAWGLRPREPFDWDTLSITFTALLEGLAARHAIEPDGVSATLFADSLLALLPTLVCRADDDTTVEQVVDGLTQRTDVDPS